MVSEYQDQAVRLDYSARRRRLREKVFASSSRIRQTVDTVLVLGAPNLEYLTGFTGSFAWLVMRPESEHLLTSGVYATQIAEEVPDIPCERIPVGVEPTEPLCQLLQALGTRVLGVDTSQSYAFIRGLQRRLRKAGIQVRPTRIPIELLRIVKDAYEVARIRDAVAIADATFEHIQRLFQPEVVEWDIAMEIDFYLRRQGAYPAFETIVASGTRSALPHARPTERRLQRGDFVTVDFGARLQGYCSDITRTVVVGKASAEQKRVYYAVLEALERSIEAIRPGRRGKQIDAVARKVLQKHGLSDYFGHSLGHSLGLAVHDGRGFSPREKGALQVGMVLTVEPGVYIPGFGGVRIEQDVLVTETGCEVLSRSPIGLIETGG
ncbi:MAG: hypothetical protein C4336_08205 [Armatimonadota bacterium]